MENKTSTDTSSTSITDDDCDISSPPIINRPIKRYKRFLDCNFKSYEISRKTLKKYKLASFMYKNKLQNKVNDTEEQLQNSRADNGKYK